MEDHDPLEKSGRKYSGETIEDFMEKDPLALPLPVGENPNEKFVNPMEQNEVIEITLDDDTDTCKSKGRIMYK